MKIKAFVLTCVLACFYPFTLLFKVNKKRIIFISLEHDELVKDFALLYRELSGKDYQLKTLLFKFEPGLRGTIKYGFMCIRQLFYIQTSGMVVLDYNNVVVSKFKHRKEVTVLQCWHATGALKQFGNDVPRDYYIKNYDYAIVNAPFFQPIFARAFNIPVTNVEVTGIPNNDKFFRDSFLNNNRASMLEKYPQLVDKKVVTYAPTFRGRMATGIREPEIDLNLLQKELGDEYIIIYKTHPLIVKKAYNNPNILCLNDEYISVIFCVTDILISDYSAITIDWMLFNKPVIGYAPDLDQYAGVPGLTIDYRMDFPGEIIEDETLLGQKIKTVTVSDEEEDRLNFKNKMYAFNDGDSTSRVVDFIEKIMATK